jgi:hypothetical protein
MIERVTFLARLEATQLLQARRPVGLDATTLLAHIRPSRTDAARGRERCACGIASVLVGYGTSTSLPFAAAAGFMRPRRTRTAAPVTSGP